MEFLTKILNGFQQFYNYFRKTLQLDAWLGFEYTSAANNWFFPFLYSQPAFTCSKLTIETLEQGLK